VVLWLRFGLWLWLWLRRNWFLVKVVEEGVVLMIFVEVVEPVLLVEQVFSRRVVDWSRRPIRGSWVVVLRLRLGLGLWLGRDRLLVEMVEEVVVVVVLVEVLKKLGKQVPSWRVVDRCWRPVCGRWGVVLWLRLGLRLWLRLGLRWHGLLVEMVEEVVVVMVLVEVTEHVLLVEQLPGRRMVDRSR
jgi:hypothetical protein